MTRIVRQDPALPALLLGLSVLLLLALAPSNAHPQEIRGRVMEAGTSTPVEGALVLLLDDGGQQRGGSLSNAEGHFLIRASAGERYRLRVERIGYGTVTSETFRFEPSAFQPLVLTLEPVALELEGLRVQGQRRCLVRPEEGLTIATLWEEARKALLNTRWHEIEGHVHFGVVRFERDVDPVMGMILSETREPEEWVTGNPIRAIPAEELIAGGFIQPAGSGFQYFGPDAEVLLSDPFLDTHCFRLSDDRGPPGTIGLSFEPARPGALPDVTGTLWLDRQQAKPRVLEFNYTRDPWPEAKGVAEGRVEFEELSGGIWIVRRWRIRMPRMERHDVLARGGRSGLRVAGIVEAGGEVVRTRTPLQAEPSPGPTASLSGTVWDSVAGAPLAGADVYLSGTSHAALSDGEGRFRIEGVPEGRYSLAFRHPAVDAVGVYPPAVEVRVEERVALSVSLAVPSTPTLLAALCGGSGREEGSSVVLGSVRTGEGGERVSAAEVRVEWTDYRIVRSQEVLGDVQTLRVESNERGRFRVCGVPPGVLLAARASLSGAEGPVRRAAVGRNEILVMDLSLDPADEGDPGPPLPACAPGIGSPESGALQGRVVDASTGTPIGGTTVWAVPVGAGESLAVRADGSGAFAFCDLPPGDYLIRTALRGVGEARAEATVAAGETPSLELPFVLASDTQPTGSIQGRVVSAEGTPVATAEVRIAGGKATVTGSDGSFTLKGIPVGSVQVEASLMGQGHASGEVIIGGGQTVTVELRLTLEPIALEPLVVEAVRYSSGGLLTEVRRRAASPWGTVLMDVELEQRQRRATRTTDMLYDQGMTILGNGGAVFMHRTQCAPHVYLDGVKITRLPRSTFGKDTTPRRASPMEEAAQALNIVHPANLAAVEIYRGPGEIPGEFLDSDARCGVILLWTRRGGMP